ESSLSPCVHAIIAARIGYGAKAYEMYLRTSRLDLDDYNNEVREGLHITSMAGTWMSIVEGFGGKRIKNEQLHLNPFIPKQWDEYSFMITFRENRMEVKVTDKQVTVVSCSENTITFFVYNEQVTLKPKTEVVLKMKGNLNEN
ncbi:MAG: glycoside hydrolase family 65 protein, partial [Cytophagaceae bacterium]|nr:glycoside hydrolase family 65 protein [Cytophagaceae bacterium]